MHIITLILLAMASQPALALGDEEVLSAWQQDNCILMLAADRDAALLRLSSHSQSDGLCDIRFESLRTMLADGLAQLPDSVNWDSFYFGRAIEHRWLSRGLADAALFDERWDGEQGTSFEGHPNQLVAELLAQPGLIHRIYPLFEAQGFRVAAVGVEKVLGTDYQELTEQQNETAESCGAEAIVPFDAQIWLKLQYTETDTEQAR